MFLSNLLKAGLTSLLSFFLLLHSSTCHGQPLFPLGKEDVFCVYFKLSGQPIANQDIEDLCFALGRPIFSPFKPVEMFSNPSIEEMKSRLLKKMREYGSDPLFSWKFVAKADGGKVLHWGSEPPEQLPHATSFIRSTLTSDGWKRIEEAARKNGLDDHGRFQIEIRTRAKGIDQLPEKRIVAHEELRIPIRIVVFDPLEIQVFHSASHTGAEPQKSSVQQPLRVSGT